MTHIDNPAFNYEAHGQSYALHRRTDPRIAGYVYDTLDGTRSVLNVGAGAGSYEPDDRYVVAVEPSAVMRAQRLHNGKTPAINAVASALPFDDDSFDAVMAMVTIHHWLDIEKGLTELSRVARHKVLVMTFDPDALDEFWNVHYFPELIGVEKKRYPTINRIVDGLGTSCEIKSIPIPIDCIDGFQEAFYARPEAFLDPQVRLNQSAWGFLPEGRESILVERLAADLNSGAWDDQYGEHRTMPYFMGSLRLIVADLGNT